MIPHKVWWFKEYETLPNLWQDNGGHLNCILQIDGTHYKGE